MRLHRRMKSCSLLNLGCCGIVSMYNDNMSITDIADMQRHGYMVFVLWILIVSRGMPVLYKGKSKGKTRLFVSVGWWMAVG